MTLRPFTESWRLIADGGSFQAQLNAAAVDSLFVQLADGPDKLATAAGLAVVIAIPSSCLGAACELPCLFGVSGHAPTRCFEYVRTGTG